MIADLGTLAATLVLALAVAQSIIPLIGSYTGNSAVMRTGVSLATGQFIMCIIAFICLGYLFLTNDFGVSYVANHSNSKLPWFYQIAAIWGGHEGSILLWMLMLAGWGFAVAITSKNLPEPTVARVLAVMGMISVGFAAFLLETSNPFDRIFPPLAEGKDLNPLLQDPGLIIHPPMLYMGYVGLSVAFAFAIAALLGGRLDSAWARWSRPWTVIAWAFLTFGITLGSWWAYYELGWGGWWFWDPVENASFMPWLAATALIHSLAVTEKRGAFKSWTVLLAIMSFSLSLLGTFLVRSGILTSVHAFATDPERGQFILIFLALVVGASLLLYAIRIQSVRTATKYDPVSRETLLILNNVFLTIALFMVLFCTLFPIMADGFGKKISIGKPFFDLQFGILMTPLFFLVGFAAFSRWKRDSVGRWMATLKWPLIIGLAGGAVIPWIGFGEFVLPASIGSGLGCWMILAAIAELSSKGRTKTSRFAGLKKLSRSYYGMQLAHFGLAVCVLGVTYTSHYHIERDVSMKIGESVFADVYEFRFDKVEDAQGPNYKAKRATVTLLRDGNVISKQYPETREYLVQKSPMTEAAIDAGFTRDLFVALGDDLGGNAWSFRIRYKPFIRWIWGGGIIMLLGGLLAISDKRYRRKKQIPHTAVA